MAQTLNLTKAGEYAVAALARLALEPGQGAGGAGRVTIPALARRQGLPPLFLSKIIARCAKAGFVRSRKGVSGGVALARPPEQITVLEIIETLEGDYARDYCVFYRARRCDGPRCPVYCPLRQKEEAARAALVGVTLADMAAALRRHPEAGLAWVSASVERFVEE